MFCLTCVSSFAQTRVDGVMESRTVYAPDPLYTAAAEQANIKGSVVHWAKVGADGCVQELSIAKRLGYGLDEAALQAVSLWKFRPAKDHPGAIRINIEVNFDPRSPNREAPKQGPCPPARIAKSKPTS